MTPAPITSIRKRRAPRRSRGGWVAGLVALTLLAGQATLVLAKDKDKPSKEQSQQEKDLKECEERKHKDKGQDAGWRAEHCPNEPAAETPAESPQDPADDPASDEGSKSDDGKKAKDEEQVPSEAASESKGEQKEDVTSPGLVQTPDGGIEDVETIETVRAGTVEVTESRAIRGSGGGLASVTELAAAGGDKDIEYYFLFADGIVASGSADTNDWQVRADFSMTTHLSCSDPFTMPGDETEPNGWGVKGSPVYPDEPQIITYFIKQFTIDKVTGLRVLKKECSGTFGPTIDLSIVKTNDANGDGAYSDSETASAAGANVPFKAVIANNGTGPMVIDTLTDIYPGVSVFAVCPGLVGTILAAAGGNATCTFTVNGYAPAANTSITNTASVTGHLQTLPTLTDQASDTSVVTSPPPPPVIDISVVKTNNANGDGAYSDSETAPSAGANVPFRAVITNNSAVPVVLTSLTDIYPGVSTFGVCPALVGTTLAASGGSATCNFTVNGYSPPATQSLTDTVTAVGTEVGVPSNSDSASDTSTVNTPATPTPPVISMTVVKTNNANGDGTFSDSEEAPEAGSSVPFQAVITNTSQVPVRLTALTDVYPGVSTLGVCPTLLGSILQPGQSVTCSFTLDGYSPPASSSGLVNTVAGTVTEVNNPTNTTTATDTSTVTSTEVLPRITPRGPGEDETEGEVLAATGAGLSGLLTLALALLLSGAAATLRARRLRREES